MHEPRVQEGGHKDICFFQVYHQRSWAKFQQLAGVVRGQFKSDHECHRPHACYATTQDIDVDTDDITFQAFDKDGSIVLNVGPIPVGDLQSALLMAEQHQHYDSMSKLIYERKWIPKAVNLERSQKRTKKSRDIIPVCYGSLYLAHELSMFKGV